MADRAYVEFLQTYLPHLTLQWQGFRKVRGQVIKRLKRRMKALQLHDLSAYRAYLETHPEAWLILDGMCRISISRFYRDHDVFETLRADILPRLAQYVRVHHEGQLRCWSAGCASGEEVYTLNRTSHNGDNALSGTFNPGGDLEVLRECFRLLRANGMPIRRLALLWHRVVHPNGRSAYR